jgi:tetratricopeptide (TPR) repeat protein
MNRFNINLPFMNLQVKKKMALLVAVILLQINPVDAQLSPVDSLKLLLKTERQDTARVLLLNKLSYQYYNNSTDTALIFAQDALALAREIGFTKGEAISLMRLGGALSATGNFSKALELHLEALKKAEAIKNETIAVIVMTNIGSNYSGMGNYREGINYMLKALDLSRQMDNKTTVLYNLANLGDSYEKLDILDSARLYTMQAFDLSIQPPQYEESTATTLNNLGNIYSKMGQDAVAMNNYTLSIPLFLKQEIWDGLAEAYLGMARLFRRAEAADSSFYYAKLSLDYAKKGGFVTKVMDASNFLTEYYVSVHNVDSAFAYQRATIAAKDTLFSQEKQRTIQSLTFDETMRQQNLALDRAAQEKQRRDNIQFGLIAIAILGFAIVFLLLSRTVVVNDKWIRFLGMIGLLLVFEFMNLFMHPYINKVTLHTPLFTLLVMVLIASFLIPLHHRLEIWIKEKLVVKNKRIRLAAAKKTVAMLEKEEENFDGK